MSELSAQKSDIQLPFLTPRSWKVLAVLSFFSVLLTGCTTVNRGVVDHLFVDTVPQGARVSLSKPSSKGRTIICPQTPCAIELPRRSRYIATITHQGYEPLEILISSRSRRGGLAGSVASNSVVGGGGLVALGAGTGAALSQAFPAVSASTGAGLGASALAGPAAGVAVGMIAIDVATGAGLNLSPNPIVLQLAPQGASQVAIDPHIELLKELPVLREAKWRACLRDNPGRPYRLTKCIKADEALTEIKEELRANTQLVFVPNPNALPNKP